MRLDAKGRSGGTRAFGAIRAPALRSRLQWGLAQLEKAAGSAPGNGRFGGQRSAG